MIPRIAVPSSAIYLEPDAKSGLETEALFGEEIFIHQQNNDWTEITLVTDNYHGWIRTNDYKDYLPPTHHIIAPRSFATISLDVKSSSLMYLPLGALVRGEAYDDKLLKIYNAEGKTGFIPHQHALPIGSFVDDYVHVAEMLIGTPYRWGGRDSMGIDCSALVQLSLGAAGNKVMRNSGDQERTSGIVLEKEDQPKRGTLVFWDGHVGIMQDQENLLHANQFHGMVASENLQAAIPRLEGATKSITRFVQVHS